MMLIDVSEVRTMFRVSAALVLYPCYRGSDLVDVTAGL